MFGFSSIPLAIGAVVGALIMFALGSVWVGVVTIPAERHEAAQLRDAEWKDKMRAAEAKAAEARRSAQTRIDAAEAHYHHRDQKRAGQMAALEDALRKEEADAARDPGGTCRVAIPRGLSGKLDAIGSR